MSDSISFLRSTWKIANMNLVCRFIFNNDATDTCVGPRRAASP
jgi:hypothetical protein